MAKIIVPVTQELIDLNPGVLENNMLGTHIEAGYDTGKVEEIQVNGNPVSTNDAGGPGPIPPKAPGTK